MYGFNDDKSKAGRIWPCMARADLVISLSDLQAKTYGKNFSIDASIKDLSDNIITNAKDWWDSKVACNNYLAIDVSTNHSTQSRVSVGRFSEYKHDNPNFDRQFLVDGKLTVSNDDIVSVNAYLMEIDGTYKVRFFVSLSNSFYNAPTAAVQIYLTLNTSSCV